MINLILLPIVFAFFIALVVEFYKKILRKDKARVVENIILALILSTGFGCISYLILPLSTVFSGVNNTPWAIVPYTIVIYLIQKPTCMNFIKPLVKNLITKKVN